VHWPLGLRFVRKFCDRQDKRILKELAVLEMVTWMWQQLGGSSGTFPSTHPGVDLALSLLKSYFGSCVTSGSRVCVLSV